MQSARETPWWARELATKAGEPDSNLEHPHQKQAGLCRVVSQARPAPEKGGPLAFTGHQPAFKSLLYPPLPHPGTAKHVDRDP